MRDHWGRCDDDVFQGRVSNSQSDVTVGSFGFAEGTFGSTRTTFDATTVGIGQPRPIDTSPGGRTDRWNRRARTWRSAE